MRYILIMLLSVVVSAWVAVASTAAPTSGNQVTDAQEIVDLLKAKKIEVKTKGAGIKSVSVEVRRLGKDALSVRIPVGTFFVSQRASAQNMVATEERTLNLRDDAWVSLSVPAACANRPRKIPQGQDSFAVQRSPNRQELEKLMPVLRRAGASFPVQQAAVWIVTDNASYSALGILVQSHSPMAFGGSRVIQENEAARAMKITDEAGINITKKAIWQDRKTIMQGVKDEDLKRWLQDKAGK